MEIEEHPVPSFGKIPESKKLWFWFFFFNFRIKEPPVLVFSISLKNQWIS
jgi:hypothetical protein